MKLSGILSGFLWTSLTLVVGTSAISPVHHNGVELQVGEVLPEMKSLPQEHRLYPPEQSTRYTLVHFWASYDATSRATNVAWTRFFAHELSDKIAYRAVSLDPDYDVYERTLLLDKLKEYGPDKCLQYVAGLSQRDEVIARYGLEQGLHSYLIDDQGVVRCVDPTREEIEEFYLL